MKNVTSELKKGVLITALSKYSIVIVQIIVMAVLSRLITPEEFGIVAIIMVFIVFFSFLGNIGIGSAIIQNKQLNPKDISDIFYTTIIWGFILSGFYYIFSYVLKLFFKDAVYVQTAIYLCLIVFFNAVTTVPNALLRKKSFFKKIGVIEILSNLVSGIIAIVLAFKGYSYYSIIYQTIIRSVLIFVGNFYYCEIELYLKFSLVGIKKILGYSIYGLVTNLLDYTSRSMDNILIGKFLGTIDLGYYDRAYRLMLFPLKNLSLIISPVLHPILTKEDITKKEVYKIYLKIINLLCVIGLPFSVFLFFTAPEIITIMYGKNWSKSIMLFQLLTISLFPQLISSIIKSFYLISGEVKAMFKVNLVTNGILVTLISIGVYYQSMKIIAILISAAYLIKFVSESILLNKIYFREPWIEYFKNLKSGIIISVCMILPLYYLGFFYNKNGVLISFMIKGSLALIIFITLMLFMGEINGMKKLLKRGKIT